MVDNEITGIITTRQCPTCGHHEVGYTTHDGTFHPLKSGDRIQVLGQEDVSPPLTMFTNAVQPIPKGVDVQSVDYDVWVPEPVQCDWSLGMKYGVLIPSNLWDGEMTGMFYEMAYLQKMIMLIEKESSTPLPFLLDHFFSAPNLATGNPKQIAQALLQELDEVKKPVMRVRDWLEKKDTESLKKLIHPKPVESLINQAKEENQIKQALENLTLEAFFELLCS